VGVDGGLLFMAPPGLPSVHRQLCTPMYTADSCDYWCNRCQSFLENFGLAAARSGNQAGFWSALGALADPGGEFLDVIEDLVPVCHLVENLLLGVHDRGVIAAECLSDLG